MLNKRRIVTEADRRKAKLDSQKRITESFDDMYSRIKRVDEVNWDAYDRWRTYHPSEDEVDEEYNGLDDLHVRLLWQDDNLLCFIDPEIHLTTGTMSLSGDDTIVQNTKYGDELGNLEDKTQDYILSLVKIQPEKIMGNDKYDMLFNKKQPVKLKLSLSRIKGIGDENLLKLYQELDALCGEVFDELDPSDVDNSINHYERD